MSMQSAVTVGAADEAGGLVVDALCLTDVSGLRSLPDLSPRFRQCASRPAGRALGVCAKWL